MTATVHALRRLKDAPPLSPAEAPPPPRRRGLLSRFFRFLFRSASRRMEPEQSRPAVSAAPLPQPRDGGASHAYRGELPAFLRREPVAGPGIRRIRPAPPPRTEDCQPKAPPAAVDLAPVQEALQALLRECPPAPKAAPAPVFDIGAMRAKLRGRPRCHIKKIAATIGCDPGELWGFATGMAA